MRRLLWFVGWVGVAVWSLFAFAVYGIVNVIGEAAMRNADMLSDDPETVEGLWRLLSWLHGLSTSVTLVVWGVVTLVILSVPWLFDRFTAAARPAPPVRRAPDGVIDLQHGDYTIHAGATPGPAADRFATPRTGPVPRIGPPHG